jgi:protocatechuate 3,4-dioxygenase beta subunit
MKKLELKKVFVVLGAVLCIATLTAVAQETLIKTPPDHEGPFYPVTKQDDEDNDLTKVNDHKGTAKGDVLNLSGVIVNTGGEPLQDITIEIWQTDPNGVYLHPGDSTPGERDPNFQYWGKDTTDSEGAFSFKTILPGPYYPRPAHIHYKLWQKGNNILTSQIYFRKFLKGKKHPSMSNKMDLQSVELKATPDGEFKAFFKIVF